MSVARPPKLKKSRETQAELVRGAGAKLAPHANIRVTKETMLESERQRRGQQEDEQRRAYHRSRAGAVTTRVSGNDRTDLGRRTIRNCRHVLWWRHDGDGGDDVLELRVRVGDFRVVGLPVRVVQAQDRIVADRLASVDRLPHVCGRRYAPGDGHDVLVIAEEEVDGRNAKFVAHLAECGLSASQTVDVAGRERHARLRIALAQSSGTRHVIGSRRAERDRILQRTLDVEPWPAKYFDAELDIAMFSDVSLWRDILRNAPSPPSIIVYLPPFFDRTSFAACG